MRKLKDKVAVIIGGTGDIGFATARLEARPACQRGIVVPEPLVLEDALEMAKKLVTK